MTKFTKLVALASIMLSVSVATNAQTNEKDYEPYPHMFVGVQGGVQNTFNKEFNNWKTFTPTASLSFGSWFIPQVGARLHFNGLWNKSGVDYLDDTEDGHYKYNYLTSSADLLLNLCTIFGKKDYYPVNLYYVMGLGANYAWEGRGRAEDAAATYLANMKYADNDNRWAFNGRVGLGLDIPVCKNLSVNVEGDLNHIVPGKSTKFNTDLLQLTVQAGLAYKFGFKKKPAPEEVWETRIDTIWYDDIAYTPRVEDGSITWNVFYKIRESDFNDPDVNDPAEAQLAAIGAFLKDHRECTVSIKSYADVQTGNPKINMGYSQQRSEKAVKALTEAGVDPSIIKATGLKDVKDQYTVKKFRTREVRELVK